MNPLTSLATTMYLAQDGNGETDDRSNETSCGEPYEIMCSGLWDVIQGAAASIAVLVVLAGIVLMVKNVIAARPAGFVKSLLMTVLAAALLANLQFIALIINLGDNAVSLLIDAVSNLFSSGGD